MLNIYKNALEVCRLVTPVLVTLKKRDANLWDQLNRASTSPVLNIAEGGDSRGRLRQARYHDALASMREVNACLDVALAREYISTVDPELRKNMAIVIVALTKILRG